MGMIAMDTRIVDAEITLIPYYPNYETAYAWYQDYDVCKQVDNIDHLYSMDRLKAMYGFLSTHGDCFYIEYRGTLVGDVTLRDNGELSIVICKEYQNRHIGRRCISGLLKKYNSSPRQAKNLPKRTFLKKAQKPPCQFVGGIHG